MDTEVTIDRTYEDFIQWVEILYMEASQQLHQAIIDAEGSFEDPVDLDRAKHYALRLKGFTKQLKLSILQPQYVTLDTLYDYNRFALNSQLPSFDQYIYSLYDEPYTHDATTVQPYTPTDDDYIIEKYEPSQWVKKYAPELLDADGLCTKEFLNSEAQKQWDERTSLEPFYEASKQADLQDPWIKPLAELQLMREEDDEKWRLKRHIKELILRINQLSKELKTTKDQNQQMYDLLKTDSKFLELWKNIKSLLNPTKKQ